jgi:pimeloyl-ACP methyl ester carboxylesterase
MFHGWSDVWLSPEYREWSMLQYLPAITAPVLAIQGEDDEYGTAAQVEAILDRVSGAREGLMIPECGHVPHFQARDRVLERIIGFLGEQVPA